MKKSDKHYPIENYPDISDIASSNECTGMIPTPPESSEEYESYQDLYTMEIPKEE